MTTLIVLVAVVGVIVAWLVGYEMGWDQSTKLQHTLQEQLHQRNPCKPVQMLSAEDRQELEEFLHEDFEHPWSERPWGL